MQTTNNQFFQPHTTIKKHTLKTFNTNMQFVMSKTILHDRKKIHK